MYFSPYNKAFNFQKSMKFDEPGAVHDKPLDSWPLKFDGARKWNEISDFILNHNGDFLRKSLRCINKEMYKNAEEMSRSIIKLRPRRSR
mmetsp:Transcript_21625/g.24873  ORF Transcript_21625/g.24873 Transcript_21625/m.24873 type:complete len:89 (-) Transcript_21625:816-1082(-)